MGFPFSFVLGDEAVEVRFGPLTIRRVRYDDIVEVRPEYILWNEHYNNVWPWRFLTIRRKTGIFKNFVINPADREEFIAHLEARLRQYRA